MARRQSNVYQAMEPLQYFQGQGGLPFIEINNRSARAVISLYGGQVLSFQPHGERNDMLFLSSKARYDGKVAIRGGIPVCWPWFGPDPSGLKRPNHGFARLNLWRVLHTETSTDFATGVTLGLTRSKESRDYWPYEAELTLRIGITDTLNLELQTRNLGNTSMSMTQALHAYFHISDIERVTVSGLENHTYLDALDDGRSKRQSGSLKFSQEIDRVYTDVQNSLTIEDSLLKRRIRLTSRGSRSAVVWNPWQKTGDAMVDLAPGDYRCFLCVERGNVKSDAIQIEPGGEHRLSTHYELLSEN